MGYFLRRASKGKKWATTLFPFPLGFGVASFLILRRSLESSSPQLLDQIGGFYVLLFALLIGSTGAGLLSTDLPMPIPRKMRLQRAVAGYWSRWTQNLLWATLGSTGFLFAEMCFHVRQMSQIVRPLFTVLVLDCMLFPILLWIGLIAARRPTVRVGAFSLLILSVTLLADLQSRLQLNGAYLVVCALLLALSFHSLCLQRLKGHFLRGDLVPVK